MGYPLVKSSLNGVLWQQTLKMKLGIKLSHTFTVIDTTFSNDSESFLQSIPHFPVSNKTTHLTFWSEVVVIKFSLLILMIVSNQFCLVKKCVLQVICSLAQVIGLFLYHGGMSMTRPAMTYYF